MSRSRRVNTLIPQPIADALTLEHAKCGYKSRNAMIVGLARYHLIVGKPHPLTAGIDAMPLEDQDIIDDFLLELTRRGLALRGQFLTRLVRDTLDSSDHSGEDFPALLPEAILTLARRWQAGEDVWTGLQPG